MQHSVSVVVPVKDGARYLAQVLDAVAGQRVDCDVEMLVVDSGSGDGSQAIARRYGARVVEIDPGEFGHGRTRNLAAEEASGDRIAFLTQDATPASETWLAALVGPLDEAARVGLTFGPHLPRPDTTPMIARELKDFFGSFGPAVRIDGHSVPGEPASGFFSNVNSCVLRECWEQVRFRDVAYSEDQAFARDAMAAGWKKAFVPAAGVLHAHDYPWQEFMRRYFDEYRGLRETTGHVESLRVRHVAGFVAAQVRGDLAFMREASWDRSARLAWGMRSARHHATRAVAAGLGSRHDRLPHGARTRLSLENRPDSTPPRPRRIRAKEPFEYVDVGSALAGPATPLSPALPPDAYERPLHVAWIVPPFRRGSGGHMTLFTIARELEQFGHSNSVWIHDPGSHMYGGPAVAKGDIDRHFTPLQAGVFTGLEDWHGADVAFATGWQTAFPLWLLPDCGLKAYLVQDLEPEFYPRSVDRMWAELTYSMGYACVAASDWLRDLLRLQYDATAESFELGVDFDVYRTMPGVTREPATVAFYARPATPRRATELGLLALEEVANRRPEVRLVLFGDTKPPSAPFDYDFLGVADEAALAQLYNRATVGLVLSLTNYSRLPKEMMACGLPVVDTNHPSVTSAFPSERAIEQAEPDPSSIADRVVALLDDVDRRGAQAERATQFVSGMTWTASARGIESHVKRWLGARWSEQAAPKSSAVAGERRA